MRGGIGQPGHGPVGPVQLPPRIEVPPEAVGGHEALIGQVRHQRGQFGNGELHVPEFSEWVDNLLFRQQGLILLRAERSREKSAWPVQSGDVAFGDAQLGFAIVHVPGLAQLLAVQEPEAAGEEGDLLLPGHLFPHPLPLLRAGKNEGLEVLGAAPQLLGQLLGPLLVGVPVEDGPGQVLRKGDGARIVPAP